MKKEDEVQPIQIGMAEMVISKTPATIITTVGSCIALCMYDPIIKIGGMVHIVLPNNPFPSEEKKIKQKYADTAVMALFSGLILEGADRERIRAKIAGGANMFLKFGLKCEALDIGANNAKMTKKKLAEIHVPLIAEDTGGNHARRIKFDTDSGRMTVITDEEVKVL